jgi:hypothetical protein
MSWKQSSRAESRRFCSSRLSMGFDLVDQAVVENEDILRLDVCAAVLLEQAERVAEIEDALKDWLLVGV